MSAMHVRHAASRIPHDPFRAELRLDPYWEYVWSRRSHAEWREREQMRARASAGLARADRWFLPTVQDTIRARQQFLQLRRPQKLATLGAVHAWRTLSTQQLQAFTGDRKTVGSNASLLRQLYALRLLDVGHQTGFRTVTADEESVREWLIRPSRSDEYERAIEPLLSFPERVKVTGGQRWHSGGQYDRHNILAAEFALRAAEFTPIATVLGERWSSARELLYEGWGRPFPFTGQLPGLPQFANRADLTLVRADGLRIAVEVTASAGQDFEEKAAKWAMQLASAPLSQQGTVVLFLVCGEQHAKARDNRRIVRVVKRAVQKAVERHPGTQLNRSYERMFVATWQELFPAAHQLADDFAALPVACPLGYRSSGAVERIWEDVHLLDPTTVPYLPADGLDPVAVARNAGILAGTPHWLRHPDTPQVAGIPVRELWPEGLPGVVRAHGQAKGAAGAPGYPARLRV